MAISREELEKAEVPATPIEYVIKYILPVASLSLVGVAVLDYLIPTRINILGFSFNPLYSIPVSLIIIMILYPKFLAGSKANEIEQNLHLFITYLGTVSTAISSRTKLAKLASEKKEYGAVAEEMRKVWLYSDRWKRSFSEACSLVAARTPSPIFEDFLSRLAHAAYTGEDLRAFFRKEQNVVMNDYEVVYRQGLYNVEILKELYISLTTSLAFVLAFIVIFPMISQSPVLTLFGVAFVLFVVAEVSVVTAINMMIPKDTIKHNLDVETEEGRKQKIALPFAIVASIAIGVLAYLYLPVTLVMVVGIASLPLIYVGYLSSREETHIKRIDANFPAFIRSLGATVSAQSGSITTAIASLKSQDFGPLTRYVRRLHRRLALRGEKERAWYFFSAETGSKLVHDFTTIFVETTGMGGRATDIGEIISENFLRMNHLRKFRWQSAGSLKGILYGTMFGLAIAVYVTAGIVDVLQGIFSKMTIPSEVIGIMYQTQGLGLINFLIFTLIVLHASAASILLKISDGGIILNALYHFGIMMLIAGCVSMLIPRIMHYLFGVTGAVVHF